MKEGVISRPSLGQATDEYERFAVGSLLALRQYCSSPAAAAAIEREGAMRGGQYDVVVWDLERELLEELTDARLLSGVVVAAQIRWLRSALPAETSLLLLDVPPVWEDGSPTHSPGWQRTLAAFPASLRRGLEQRVACASVEVGRVAEELPNTAFVRRAAALREGDLLEWVHTTRRAAAETAAAVVHAYADARASPVPKAARPEAPPWALLDGVFTPSELARVIALCEQLDRSAVRDPEIAGFKLATTTVVHYSVSADGAPSFAGDEPPDPLLDTGWLFRPLVAALRRGDAALGGALPQRAFCTSVQYNRYHRGDHFEHFHVDEVECETAYKSLSLVLFLSRPDEYGGGEFELRRGEGGQVTALRPDANSAAVFCAREVFHRVRRVTRGARRTLVLWACATRASAVCDGPAEPCVAFGRIGASPFL
ncbi:hypothetical protein EMIHUDRAFT_194998 [Emiliania huxleyi CCMP1516]|uniref:Fe2OG dioxygenase domain-containing protein n=2 Tax=Emiliania huxleyi TaxID=2903 RepID=A0A0D3JGR2_EMIH1|nr:hypothetical protein EMIHUDRAFT_194998 [Emiliania huxleyi CCMP1516]EOD22697.1 hypothetical protein EMIHUDRAFT_194998 [Emiliania huxleyi CCMP1516]|eukprot:XP_005775126.1 hypothetical protein EMIHUDRAFT_194998 [Emiliania huxleyi CCMP1516]